MLLSRIVELEDDGAQLTGFIEVVATHPAHRRTGIAEYLVRNALTRFAAAGVKRAVLLVDRTKAMLGPSNATDSPRACDRLTALGLLQKRRTR
ncbi:hypothetical protein BA062_18270 [Prauserella flavalba]|uniref:N-acetyltransferase domain-containing protein n=1 Tax=Prauserella flavalba TaxID=1477506 RepID=A0A318LIL4_9PSEU|nr:GNAT family N-acetyltransferase [Prauserella flavalba]PXY30510.1 hypothetical protein BA062_18270 [Prauserella flavalba]